MVNMRECIKCGQSYVLALHKPGLITECWDCGRDDVIKLVAEEGNSDDGSVEFMTNNPITIRYIRERLEKEEPIRRGYER